MGNENYKINKENLNEQKIILKKSQSSLNLIKKANNNIIKNNKFIKMKNKEQINYLPINNKNKGNIHLPKINNQIKNNNSIIDEGCKKIDLNKLPKKINNAASYDNIFNHGKNNSLKQKINNNIQNQKEKKNFHITEKKSNFILPIISKNKISNKYNSLPQSNINKKEENKKQMNDNNKKKITKIKKYNDLNAKIDKIPKEKNNSNNKSKKNNISPSPHKKISKNDSICLSTIMEPHNPKKTKCAFNLCKNTSNFDNNPYDAENIKLNIISLAKEVKLKELKIYLIFFYEDLSEENVGLYNQLKLDVIGGYYGCRNKVVFKKLLIEMEKLKSSFFLISIGSSFCIIEDICNKYDCIQNIIIFCLEINNYKYLYDSNKKVKLISNDSTIINDYLQQISIKHPKYDKILKNVINHNLLISFYEYQHYYYIHHKMLSFFFKEDFSALNFSDDYEKKLFNYIDQNIDSIEYNKKDLKKIILHFKTSKNFLKDILKFYTSENELVYLFNRTMRNIELGMERLSFLIGPMYYSMIRFLQNKKSYLILNKKVTLYRKIYINQYDLDTYHMIEGNIICFPSFTSTSLIEGFSPTNKALKVNKINQNNILLNMELDYKPSSGNYPQGMLLRDFSSNQQEEEFLLFPFTFIKVISIEDVKKGVYKLKGKIINKNCILEFGLKKGKKVILKNEVLSVI